MSGNLSDLIAQEGPLFDVPAHDEMYTTTILWPLGVIVLVGLILGFVLMMGPRLFRARRLASAALRCPAHDQAVSVEFVEAVWDGRRVDVNQCSCFVPPTAVDCQKLCLDVDKLTERGWPGSIAVHRPVLVGGKRALHRGDEW
jgi:hypothetical protein